MLDGLSDIMSGVGEYIGTFISEKPITSAVVGAGVIGTTVIGTSAIIKASRKTTTKRKRTSKKKSKKKRKLTPLQKRRRKIVKRKGRQTPYTARGGKDRSTKRIRQTKNGQPYVILKSGKARFISKASAKRSRKTKGGRY